MLGRLGGFLERRRRRVLIGAAVAFAAAGALGGNVAQYLSTGGFEDKDAESFQAFEALEDEFDQGTPNLILVVTPRVSPDRDEAVVNDPRAVEAGTALTQRLAAEPGVDDVVSFWTTGAAPFRNEEGTRALVLARIVGDEDEVDARAEELVPIYEQNTDVLDVQVGGFAAVFNEVSHTIESDLTRAELIAFPITLILLFLIFRGVIAAVLPLAIGVLAIVGTFLVLRVLAEVTQVSIFALNLTTAMGLGLAIDYSLFMVSRFREELAHGHDVSDAVRTTVATAGRTVLFSAITVAVSLSALLIFPLAFLRSFAYGGIPVVLLAALASIVVLPAVLAALGTRIDKWSFRRAEFKEPGEGMWHRIAVTVMRRPIPIATVVVGVLVFVGLPFLRINLGLPDDRVLPESADSRTAHDIIREEFDANEGGALSVIALGVGGTEDQAGEIDAYAARLSGVEGVSRVDAATGVYAGGQRLPVEPAAQVTERFSTDDDTWMSVVPAVEPVSDEGQQLVHDLRAVDAPFDEVLVGGMSAQLVDAKDSLFGLLPWALAIIALTTFVVLFLMVGSLVVPIKALVLNLLSLTATFGAMVWIFQDGNLSGLLDFTAIGAIEVTTPILMFCVAFGLSMDYEVFLLSRIKEEYDRTGDNEASVAVGLERTGRIVTAAALLIAIVFLAFATSQVTFIKLFGVGLAMAVLVDASLVRATLVPAFMRLAGRANWWAPAPLARLYDRYGFSEVEAPRPAPTDAHVLDLDREAEDGADGARSTRRPGRPLVAPGRDHRVSRTNGRGGRRKAPSERRRERPLRAFRR